MISFAEMRQALIVPLLCDALDAAGYRRQSPRLPIVPVTLRDGLLIGNAKTMLWDDMAHVDPKPYELELAAIDSCQIDDVIIYAASGSKRSGIWGELLSTSAQVLGCAGVIVDGCVRDVAPMRSKQFRVFARGTSPYDSLDRQRVIDFDISIELGGVVVEPSDLIAADQDGMVIVPKAMEQPVVSAALAMAKEENRVRQPISQGRSATAAFQTFGVL